MSNISFFFCPGSCICIHVVLLIIVVSFIVFFTLLEACTVPEFRTDSYFILSFQLTY
jgi:hypothetical protein